VASLQVYDNALADTAVRRIYNQVKQPDVAIYLDAAKLHYGKLKSWPNDGYAGGSFRALKAEPMVMDVAGRITASFTGKEAMVLNKPITLKKGNSSYSIVVSVFTTEAQKNRIILSPASAEVGNSAGINYTTTPGKWHLLIKTFNANQVKEYVDGNLQHTITQAAELKQIDSLYIGSSGNKSFSGGIAGLIVYKRALADDEIKTLTSTWLQNLHPPAGAVLDFKQAPGALSPQMIGMEAGHDDQDKANDLQYYFTNLNSSVSAKVNSWTDNPYYIDYGLAPDKQYRYSYKIRDIFGNVTGNSMVAMAGTDLSLFSIYADDFSKEKDYLLTGTQGSVWDGLIGKGDKQTAAKITAGSNNALRMESQGTNWDGNTPYGPFLYRNVKGDFTVEVEVTDVSGLAEKKVAGNNEAGLMVRAANDITGGNAGEKLLQNGIFPAWNVGNIFTNYADGDRRQTNIQSAWNFNRYLQIQRSGNLFYVRTSTDNISWVDLPGSPVLRTDLANKDVQVGLYQCTYGPKSAFGSFSNFKLVLIR
jgi:regulation of enolase protein 1 (concanavalin A-like superfamily)